MSNFTATLDTRDYIKMMETLSDLSKLEREAIINKGIQEGLDVIIKEGKKNLASSSTKVRTGNLSKSFSKYVKKKYLKGYAGFKRPKGAAAHLIDRGTKVRVTKSGANRGKVTGNYFWTKAVETQSKKAQDALMESVEKTIEKIMNRHK